MELSINMRMLFLSVCKLAAYLCQTSGSWVQPPSALMGMTGLAGSWRVRMGTSAQETPYKLAEQSVSVHGDVCFVQRMCTVLVVEHS